MLCDCGCGQEARYQLKNGKWCCSDSSNKCPSVRQKNSKARIGNPRSEETRRKMSRKGCTLTEEHKRKIGDAGKGKKHTEEAKRKMSEAKKGKIFSEEHRLNISKSRIGKFTGENNPFYGKKHSEESLKKISRKGCTLSEEHKKKIRLSFLGSKNHFFNKHHTDNSREKLKASWKESILKGERCGENNSNWKGGIACEPYCDVWLDNEYKESIKERDGYKCLNPTCNKTSTRLSLHHINYNKKDCHPLNIITLCASCNAKANKDREWHECWYKAIIIRRRYL